MAIRFLTSQNIQAGTLTVSTIANLATASNTFLVSDGGLVKYRTAAQVRSDIGAGTGSGTVTSVAVTNGTGISASVANATTTPNITITNTDRGSSQNIFKNFAVSGQSTVVADNNNDTLTLVAGSNITITTNATTDAITIASSYVDSNNYPTSLSWATATGILTLGRNGLSSLTVDLDGRYPENNGSGASGTWGINITGNASSVNTVDVSVNADFYLPFVDSNNGSPTAEFLYTVNSVRVNPSNGNMTTNGLTSKVINIAGNGSGADPYGTVAVTEPASALNYSYYGLTRAGNIGAGFGITGTNGALSLGANAFWFGTATSGFAGVMSAAWVAFNASSFRTAGPITANGVLLTGNTGTVTSVSGTGSVSGLTLTGTFTTSGSLTLGGTLSLTAANVNAVGAITNSTSGNAGTATALQTARTINGVSFNGTANIVVEPYVEDAVTTSVTRYITFVDNSTAGYKRLNEDANLTYNPGTNVLTVPTVSAALSGNATTAATLQTARTINGTSFNGSANIETSYWGTTRTITIGNTGKTVNGSGNQSWSLAEIGAQAALTNPVTGTGTTNYIPRWTGTTSQNNSIIYDNGTTVSISGTTNLYGEKLNITGTTLSSTINSYSPLQVLKLNNGNAENLEFGSLRTSAGSDWTSAGFRIQEKIDSTWMAYMQFNGTGNNGGISFGTGTSSGSRQAIAERLIITPAGHVGIGTPSPNQKLHVNGATQLGDINATTNFNTVALKVVEGTVATGPTLGSGTVGAQAVLYSNGAFGMYTGVSSTGSTWMQSQRNDAGTSTYNILLNPLGGNVGIGTISPTAIGTNITTLDIKGSSGGGIRIGVGGGKESTFYTVVGGGYLGTISSIPLYFQTDNSVKATITANGSFGVGTTTPSSRFTSTTNASGPVGYTNLCAIFGDHTNTSLTYNNGVGVAGRVLTSGGKAIYGDATSGGGWGGYFDGKGYFSGNVGIGTTTSSYPLDVNGIAMLRGGLYMTAGGTSSVPNWYFQINGSGDLVVDDAVTAQNFIFSNAGQVLIGTTVGGTPAYGSAPQFVTASATGGVIDIRSLNTNIVANSLLGRIQFTGKDDATVGYTTAVIEAIAYTSASTGNGGGGILKFMTAPNSSGQSPQARMWINQLGYVTIGSTNSNSYPLRVLTQVSNISIYADYDIVAFSDQSVKENIRPIENVIERVQKSRGVLYDRTDSGSKDNIGFIAQELEVAFPELVITNEDGTKAVKYQNAVAVMFEAIKEQQKQIDELKELVTKLIK